MKKVYKRIISTAMVLSIVIQGNTVFAKEISAGQKNDHKKLVLLYERKDSKDSIDILVNGKENKKEIKDGKLCEIVEGIDIAVIDSKKSTNLKSDITNLIKNGAEAFICVDGEDVDVFSTKEVSEKLSKSNESSKKTTESKKVESKETKKEDVKRTSKENESKEKKDDSEKVKIEITYKQKGSSNELISLKTDSDKQSSSKKEESKEENKKEEDKNKEENSTQDKEDSKEEDKNETNFNNGDVLGKTSTALIGDYYTIGKEESNFANLINDALLKKTGADIAMTNAGSILRTIPKGEVRYGDIVESVIFGNTVITKKLTGKQIRDAIEVGAEIYPEASSTFLHLGNVTYKLDANKKAGSRVTEVKVKGTKLNDSKQYLVVYPEASSTFLHLGNVTYKLDANKKAGSRVTEVKVKGTKLNDSKQYLVAMNDYMSTDYSSISGSSVEKNYGELDKVIAEYIKAKKTVNYKNDGRIKITKTVTINREKVKKVVKAIDK